MRDPRRGIALQLSPKAVNWKARTDRHRIADIRSRKEEPELNYILCDCGWRGAPESHGQHRTEVLKQRREEGQRALMEVK